MISISAHYIYMPFSRRDRSSYEVIREDEEPASLHALLPSPEQDSYGSSSQSISPRRDPGATELFGGPPMSHVIVGGQPEDSEPLHSAISPQNRWDHIRNLDHFFTRVYEYHRGGGFLCIVSQEIFSLLQFLFVVIFSTFLLECVDYQVLFKSKNTTADGLPLSGKRKLVDCIQSNCTAHFHALTTFCIIFAIFFWLFRAFLVTRRLLEFYDIHRFYERALGILDEELINLKWSEVVKRVCQVQPHIHLIISRDRLNPLDIYQRILRFQNYFVAMVNQEVLPPVIHLPLIGAVPYLSTGLLYNLKWLLFSGPLSPWKGLYAVDEEYKNSQNIPRLASEMERLVLHVGLANLLLSPFILLYQILFSFFSYGELLRREPAAFAVRRYSNYGRFKLRHFNELNHELKSRLSHSYVAAGQYMDQFQSFFVEILAKNIAFVAGALFAVLAVLSAWDEDVLTVEHVLTVMTLSGVIVVLCRSFVRDENQVWCPEKLMEQILLHIDYRPDTWKGNAHTDTVRREFGYLFQLKAQYLLEELLSPILTPWILIFRIRPKAREFVEFFNEFTVSVDSLGDICSFATFDLRAHGDPTWTGEMQESVMVEGETLTKKKMARDGKTEMSLLRFKMLNPEWTPPEDAKLFLENIDREKTEGATSPMDIAQMADALRLPHTMISSVTYPVQHPITRASLQHDLESLDISLSTMALRNRRDRLISSGGAGAHVIEPNNEASVFGSSLAPTSVGPVSDIWGVPAQSTFTVRPRLVRRSEIRYSGSGDISSTDSGEEPDAEYKDDNNPPGTFSIS
ncbi:hypothetical protein AB6A40_005236 [Gnathostoma spinigerum]|uniref:Autophagy-related protein 9 n=1 Tax=Gnathostoma spinigerum TaxID=75299 RepID=A0ABD6EPC4_9BILA